MKNKNKEKPFELPNFLDGHTHSTNETPTKRKITWKIKVPFFIILTILFIIGINSFFNKFYLVSPVQFQNPIRVRGQEYPILIKESELDEMIKTEVDKAKSQLSKIENSIVTPVIAQEPAPVEHSIPWMIDKIWARESTRGQNGGAGTLQKYCEDKGMWNEYGYGGMAKKICFKDQAEADDTMVKWFSKYLAVKTEAETFCFYRYGEQMSNCDYYQDILAL